MATAAATVTPDTLVTVKIAFNESVNRRFKLPLRDLGARVFPQKIRHLLSVSPQDALVLERYSDSLANYILLDSENPAVYKQLYRAAKAKLKLHIKATTKPQESAASVSVEEPHIQEQSHQRFHFLETVLSSPPNDTSSDMAKKTASPSSKAAMSPLSSSPRSRIFASLANRADKQPAYLRFSNNDHPGNAFCIDCNNCGGSIPGEHYHCGICDNGDYDLCSACVDAGVSCPGEDHWLLKRLVQNGIVVNSTTETLAPKILRSQETVSTEKPAEVEQAKEEPEAKEETPVSIPVPQVAQEEKKEEQQPTPTEDSRTCNGCFREFSETMMVNCNDCDDYDLCVTCLLKDGHGHHPAHQFSIIKDHQFSLKSLVLSRCQPGRHFHHAAICDGCEKRIIGVRHKCMSCPDWDYCSSCIETVDQSHPHHRFVPIYGSISEASFAQEIHYGIYCDGPLCRDKASASYITGVRYKCAVCHDTDFCAACEALPTSVHNRTHPLIKFRTPVRNVSVSTLSDDGLGGRAKVTGDRSPQVMPGFEKAPSVCSHTTVKTSPVVEKVEAEEKHTEVEETESSTAPDLLTPVSDVFRRPSVDNFDGDYSAYFMRDTVPDGTTMPPSHVFRQTWTLYNPGPSTWPVGTSVRFIGGDSMFNVNTEHPSSAVALTEAMSSNELTRPVAPSESADFSVTLKTSQHTGTSTSYWRLKLPNGTPFGHKLWCDVKIAEQPELKETETFEADSDTETEAETKTAVVGSNMIFPKLDKESPVSSIHEALPENPTPIFTAPSVSNADEQTLLEEDIESLTLEDGEDDGFFTDEEYDILDASDQESFNGKQF